MTQRGGVDARRTLVIVGQDLRIQRLSRGLRARRLASTTTASLGTSATSCPTSATCRAAATWRARARAPWRGSHAAATPSAGSLAAARRDRVCDGTAAGSPGRAAATCRATRRRAATDDAATPRATASTAAAAGSASAATRTSARTTLRGKRLLQ
jgi:hypothetical protein